MNLLKPLLQYTNEMYWTYLIKVEIRNRYYFATPYSIKPKHNFMICFMTTGEWGVHVKQGKLQISILELTENWHRSLSCTIVVTATGCRSEGKIGHG